MTVYGFAIVLWERLESRGACLDGASLQRQTGIFWMHLESKYFRPKYIVSYVCDTLDVFPDILLFRSAIRSGNANWCD